jgi:trehalose/maltose transport system substrate-binding protein
VARVQQELKDEGIQVEVWPSTVTGHRSATLLRWISARATKSLFFFLFAMALGGCWQSAKEPVTLTFLNPEWSQPDEAPTAEYAAQQFTRETGIGLRHPPVPETSLSQLELSRGLLRKGGVGPDVLGMDVIWPGILEEYLTDLKPYFGTEISSLDPDLVASYTVNGKVVAIPYHAQVGALAYRTDLLREYGYQHPPRTWDELESMAARIQAGERAKGRREFWGYIWQGAAGEGLTCNALEWQFSEGGGRIIENDRTISVNNPAAIRAWQRAKHWIGWISPPSVVAYRELDTLNVWESGGAAFRRTWQWRYRLTHRQDSEMSERTGYTSMPGGPGGRVGTLGGTGLAVSRQSAHPQEAVELIRFLIRGELQSKEESARAQPPLQSEVYDLPSILGSYGHSDTPNERKSGVISRPSNVAGHEYEEVTGAYIAAVHAVLTGQKEAPDAEAELEKQLIKITGFRTGPPRTGD